MSLSRRPSRLNRRKKEKMAKRDKRFKRYLGRKKSSFDSIRTEMEKITQKMNKKGGPTNGKADKKASRAAEKVRALRNHTLLIQRKLLEKAPSVGL
jgi:hypothetical protein